MSGDLRDQSCEVFIGMGANLGDRIGSLRRAVQELSLAGHVELVAASPVYEAKAHTLTPGEEQPPYLNAVLHLRTRRSPEDVLALCHAVEKAVGRVRRRAWEPRVLDLDVLLYGQETRREGPPLVPHPRLADRRFVLQPLADLSPNLYVPAPFDAVVEDLLAGCPDEDTPLRTSYPFPGPSNRVNV